MKLTYKILFNREIYERFRASYKGKEDIHTRLMRRYKDIPHWWFYLMLVVTLVVSLVLCTFLKDQVQMPWWGLLFAGAMAFVFTLPISIITATTNQVFDLNHALHIKICSHSKYFLLNYFALAMQVTFHELLSMYPHNLKIPYGIFNFLVSKEVYMQSLSLTRYNIFTNTLMHRMQTPGLNIITEYVMGIIYPGRPIANVCFKVYGYMSMAQAVSFLNDFKLGHYMKIPPRSMFLVQVHLFYHVHKLL